MRETRSVLVVGGTSGIGREIARYFAERADEVVLTGREAHRAETVAKELGGTARGLAFDLARPAEIGGALAGVERVDHLVLAAIERDRLTFTQFVEVRLRAGRVVEEVFVAVIREDESEALVADESLDRSVHRCCHSRFSKKEG